MNEIQKTGIWAACGVALLSLGLFLRPSQELASAKDDSGQPFYPEFNVRDVTELEITAWDKKPLPIKLSRRGDLWEIDTHEKYPTDAEHQLARATATVSNMIKGVIVSETRQDHAKFGVLDPPEKADSTLEGVGTRVSLKNAKGEVLTAVIIGKEVEMPTKGGNEPKSGLRYVRRPDQDRVYQSRVDLTRFSTKFADWIQTGLLDVNPKQAFETHNIKNVLVNNYSLEQSRGGIALKMVEKLRFNHDNKAAGTPEAPAWTMHQEVFDEKTQNYKPVALDPASEEIDYTKLNDMRNALKDLKIEDVHKKPEGLSKELKLAGAKPKDEHFESLFTAGYLIVPDTGDLISKEGEVVVGMEDGVEYVLRFGLPTKARDGVKVEEEKKAEPKKGEEEEDEESKGPKETRYLLVSARFNPNLIPEPEYEKVPGETPAEKPAGDKPEEKPAGEKPEEKPAGEKPGEKPAGEKKEEPKKEELKKEEPKKETPVKQDEPAKKAEPAAKPEEPAKKADAAKDEDEGESCQDAAQKEEPKKAEESPKAEPPKADAPKADVPKAEPPKSTVADIVPEDPKVVEATRIKRSNDIKRVEWESKVMAGKKRVDELNFRFADWYYVISEDVFKKIRVERSHLIKPKKSEGKGNTPADFDALKGGLPGLPGGLPGLPGGLPGIPRAPAPKK